MIKPSEDGRPSKPARSSKPARPKPVTADWLFRAAAHYLERYASSTENLARVLQRKIERRVRAAEAAGEPFEDEDGTAPQRHRALVEATVAHFVELKLLDDRAYAEARFASLRRRGTSLRQTAAKLGQKGVPRDMLEAVAASDEMGDAAAALAYARRRRLGPHRLRDREARRDRDVAAMMRAGFSYRDSLAAIDGTGDDRG